MEFIREGNKPYAISKKDPNPDFVSLAAVRDLRYPLSFVRRDRITASNLIAPQTKVSELLTYQNSSYTSLHLDPAIVSYFLSLPVRE
jgi:hypothetical protein